MTKAEQITIRVREEFLDHIRDFQKYGPDYISQYVASVVETQTTRRPQMKIHPKLAELVRELALDAAVMDRGLAGRSYTPSLPSSGKTVSRSRPPRKNVRSAPFSSAKPVDTQRDEATI